MSKGAQALTRVDGRYRIVGQVARGAMGEVYVAIDEASDKRLALKRMRPDRITDRRASVLIMREYHALAALQHPRIIEVYDAGVDQGLPYYTMELLDGHDLRELAPLPYQVACRYLRDVASSLALLHARRLLHRDLSPRNVRRTSGDRCKLLDFGTMIAFGVPPNLAGTPPLVPPEALRGALLDQRADLYALGALAYFLLTGKHAYPVKTFDELPRAQRRAIERPQQLVSEVPSQLDDLVMSLLSLDAAGRPSSAAEVIDRLSAIADLPREADATVAQAFLSSAKLVSRTRELAVIEERLEQALQGHGGAIVIEGAEGTGRSRMLTEAMRRAQTHGLLVVQVVGRGARGTETLAARLMQALRRAAPDASPSEATDAEHHAARSSRNSAPTGEAHAREQAQAFEQVLSVARGKGLLLAVDDVEHADDSSIALLAALSHEARRAPLVVVASHVSTHKTAAFSALATLRAAATIVTLAPLSPEECAELVTALFGDVPNLERVTDWLYRVARGNPALTLEVAFHLLARGVIRYVEGTWVLPNDAIQEVIPGDLTQARALRLQRLSPGALALAELMSIRRGGLSLALAVGSEVVRAGSPYDAIDELAREGIVEQAGDEHAFAQQAMRDAVRQRVSPERAAQLHAQLAHALLAVEGSDAALEAGWHLVHTDNALRGAKLLACVAPQLVETGASLSAAVPALEKALAVYEQHGLPVRERLRLRSLLTLAGYLFDYRLGFRYGDETVDMLYEAAGLALAERLSTRLPRGLAVVIALCAAQARHLLRRDRYPSAVQSIKYLARSLAGLMGLRATALDARGLRPLLHKLVSLRSLPVATCKVIGLAGDAFSLQTQGRQADLHDAVQAALRAIERGPLPLMLERERYDLWIGLLLMDGINEAFRTGSKALQIAARLEQMGTQLAAASGKRVRMTYHLVRGQHEQAELERQALNIHGIRGGTTWQVEWFAVPIEGIAGAMHGDLLATRRALDRLETMLSYVPSLGTFYEIVRIGYHFRRGESARAAELGERFIQLYPPRTITGWETGYGLTGMALVEIGQYERALEHMDRVLAGASERELSFGLIYTLMITARALAREALGDGDGALHELQGWLQHMAEAGEHTQVAIVHELRARVARVRGDHEALLDSVRGLREASAASGSPLAMQQAERWSQVCSMLQHSSERCARPVDFTESASAEAEREASDDTAVSRRVLAKN